MNKPPYPIVLVRARDWNGYANVASASDTFEVAVGWAVGFLLEETAEKVVIAFEYFEKDKTVRGVTVFPRETILYKKLKRIA